MNLDDLRQSLLELDINDKNNEFEKEQIVNSIKCHKALNITVALLERRYKTDFYEDLSGFNAFFNKYTSDNKLSILFEVNKEVLNEKEYRLRFMVLYKSSEETKARDKELLYKLIAKYSDGWWT